MNLDDAESEMLEYCVVQLEKLLRKWQKQQAARHEDALERKKRRPPRGR